ncbi:flagellar basal body L-ring protein FlgH [Sulfurospirillum arcachonense]|uniref:flagellar basal body L-ring protein FlgH n=1 Tax=Sulfurospirillum arcachonense TaxID=57666 RepID=UPI00046AE76A|nr:flagellar basal body L-ring protein FlgH [Sulfurospirillum arcachonense]
MRLPFSVVLVSILFVGCSTHPTDPTIEMKPPVYVQQIPPKTKQQIAINPGSIFGQGDNPLFSDLKAMHPNDIVTVVISESIVQSSDGSKSISEENKDSLGAGLMTNNGGSGTLNKITDTFNKYGNIGFEAGSTNTYTGTGSNTRNESFTTTISARIIKILGNGNYFIEGSRELLVNGEKQIVQISGVIRPYDIDQKNTIDSKYIADAKILYKTEGEIDRATQKPWGSKLVESLWPF